MFRHVIVIAAALLVMSPAAPALAVTAKEKMATCRFGADSQKLKGRPRTAFLRRCMSNKDDPRGSGAPGEPPKR